MHPPSLTELTLDLIVKIVSNKLSKIYCEYLQSDDPDSWQVLQAGSRSIVTELDQQNVPHDLVASVQSSIWLKSQTLGFVLSLGLFDHPVGVSMPLHVPPLEDDLGFNGPQFQFPRRLLNQIISIMPSNITCLNLDGTRCTDATFSVLAQNTSLAKSLRHLNLRHADITDVSAKKWKLLQSLESLCLTEPLYIGQETYAAISKLPRLQSIELTDNSNCLHKTILSILLRPESLPQLRSYRVKGWCNVDEVLMQHITSLLENRPNNQLIEEFLVERRLYRPSFHRFLQLLPNLIEPPFSFADVAQIESLFLEGATKKWRMVALEQSDPPVNPQSIRRIFEMLPNLTHLRFNNTTFDHFDQEEDLNVFRVSASLQKLVFNHCKSVPDALRYPASLRTLRFMGSSFASNLSNKIPPAEGTILVQNIVGDVGASLKKLDIHQTPGGFPANPLEVLYNRLFNCEKAVFSWVSNDLLVSTKPIVCPKIRSLDFSRASSTFAPIVRYAPQLLSFRLADVPSNVIAECLMSLTTKSTPLLKRLYVDMTSSFREKSTHSSVIDALLRLDTIEVLSSRFLLVQEDLAELASLTRLQSLTLYAMKPVDMVGARHVFRNLISLSLHDSEITNWNSIGRLPWLQNLFMASVKFVDGVDHLKIDAINFPSLEILSVSGIDNMKFEVAKLPHLTRLQVMVCKSARFDVFQCRSLTWAHFSHIPLCRQFCLVDNFALRVLVIHMTAFSEETIVDVACPNIQSFRFRDAGTRSPVMLQLCRLISSGKRFKLLECPHPYYFDPAPVLAPGSELNHPSSPASGAAMNK
eukprot:TRINITY_DN9903_c0_g1_i1.p1 TRINITY_DN9903_c0_g1~~TRINITY_DN9903_c0_g1_i1.p1  ORF type:complete len:809 (+),score=103.33 TRINITY_DN9903_c0_g1_i1:51-2477(+)